VAPNFYVRLSACRFMRGNFEKKKKNRKTTGWNFEGVFIFISTSNFFKSIKSIDLVIILCFDCVYEY